MASLMIDNLEETPKTLRDEPTQEQLTIMILLVQEIEDAGKARTSYYYDNDGSTIYADACNGVWKITCADMKFLNDSKN